MKTRRTLMKGVGFLNVKYLYLWNYLQTPKAELGVLGTGLQTENIESTEHVQTFQCV